MWMLYAEGDLISAEVQSLYGDVAGTVLTRTLHIWHGELLL